MNVKKSITLLLVLLLIFSGCTTKKEKAILTKEKEEPVLIEQLVEPAVEVLAYGSYYFIEDVVRVMENVELLNGEKEFLVRNENKYFLNVQVKTAKGEQEVTVVFRVEEGVLYINANYTERTYVLGEEVDVYQGVYALNSADSENVEYPVKLISEIPDFSKIGEYYLTYYIKDEVGREATANVPIFIVGKPEDEVSNFPEDELDQFLKKFVDTYYLYRGRPFADLTSREAYFDSALAMIMGGGAYQEGPEGFYITIEQLQDYAWTYFNYELPDNYCDWLRYDAITESCYDGFEFGYLGGDGPEINLIVFNRVVKDTEDSIIVTYIIKNEFRNYGVDVTGEWEEIWATYASVQFELVQEGNEYRIIDFKYLELD